ncbi:MAG TPA: cation:proton antiporter, partial [Nannocystaceae bacterium]|nr:cation:proton antiporter [Nannocystaceae bacterium]
MHLLQDPLTLFIVQAVLIITAARVIGLLARRLDQPMVIAEIVAGIVLGPSVLGLVAPDVLATIFPTGSLKMLGLMSQTGLVLFMFLVGLELDPTMLRGRGKSSVMISHCSIIVPFALGVVLSLWLRPALGEPADSLSFALFMGVAMAITAFPVLARILTERQLLRTPIGAVAIACAAVDDITAWCVLAFVVSIVRAGGVFDAVWTTAFALVYVFTMLYVVRPLLHRLSARMGTDRGPSQNVIAAVFVVLFASAWTTELIGIHALFGAFMFGAIVPKENGFARVLAEKLEDVVVVFLLPLFFAYSGLRTQIGLLDSASHWVWCALIILLACLGKFGGSFVPARLTGLGWRESAAVGVLMNTRGLMELVVLNIGLDLGVISPTVFTMMVLMALFTTFITSPMLQWVYPLELLRKDIIRRQAPVAAAVPRDQPALSVMVCVADARSAAPMVHLAAGLVGRKASADQVLALHLRAPAERTSSVIAGATEYALAPASRASEAAAAHGLALRTLAFDSADPARDICEVAAVKDVDLVVIGAHRPLVGHAHLGGVVRRVLENAPANVGVLLPRSTGEITRILVPFADNPHDRLALELARRLHATWGAQVTVLHVTAPSSTRGPAARAMVDEVFPGEVGGAHVRFKVVEHADAAQAVLDESRHECELVVVGVGREWGMPQRAFGLRTERLLEQGTASLLVVRASAEPLPMRQAAAPERDPGER